jgi:hypothetical protein
MIQEYYRQMRKFGCNILAVIQQYDIIKESAVRGAMIGNSKVLSTVGFNEMKRTPVEFGCQGFGRMGSGTVTSANWGHSVLCSWYERRGSRSPRRK